VDRVFQGTVTAWVDPRTGAPVNQEQKVTQTLRTSDGVDRLVVADLDLKMTPDSQKHLVHTSNGYATQISLVRTIVPYGGGALGVVLLLLGLALAFTGRRGAHRGTPANGPSDGTSSDTTTAENPRPAETEPSDREPSA
jgi:hypothetical protein